VVWASSYKVGCAVQLCPNGVKNFTAREGAIFVCNYGPGGNVIGRRPYETNGAPCSRCKDSCVDRLCGYNWTPDRDPASRSNNFVDVLIVRPVVLILTCISAYAVHYLYPDVFCYE
ncbi:hypothetical protein AMECASPLE_032434, partial [Ameca splendens]